MFNIQLKPIETTFVLILCYINTMILKRTLVDLWPTAEEQWWQQEQTGFSEWTPGWTPGRTPGWTPGWTPGCRCRHTQENISVSCNRNTKAKQKKGVSTLQMGNPLWLTACVCVCVCNIVCVCLCVFVWLQGFYKFFSIRTNFSLKIENCFCTETELHFSLMKTPAGLRNILCCFLSCRLSWRRPTWWRRGFKPSR